MRKLLLGLLLILTSALPAGAQASVRLVYPAFNTYAAAATAYAGYVDPTDFFSITGSATKTVEIIHIQVTGSGTSTSQLDINLLKRSTANTGGTPTALTKVPFDSRRSAATATVVTYAAAPTRGTLVGNICACQVELPAAAGVGGSTVRWDFLRLETGPLILRSDSEVVAMAIQTGQFPNGMKLNITIYWTEN